MPYISMIPRHLLALDQRQPFLDWLRSLPITFHARLRIYFDWLDLNASPYTPDEIDSLSIDYTSAQNESQN
jgi:hypothetical protein